LERITRKLELEIFLKLIIRNVLFAWKKLNLLNLKNITNVRIILGTTHVLQNICSQKTMIDTCVLYDVQTHHLMANDYFIYLNYYFNYHLELNFKFKLNIHHYLIIIL